MRGEMARKGKRGEKAPGSPVIMHREWREVQDVPLTNRYGIVISQEYTYQADALEEIMNFLLSRECFVDPEPTPEKAMRRWAAMAKEEFGVDVPTTSYREFFEAMPDEMIAFYEDPSYPISPHSKME